MKLRLSHSYFHFSLNKSFKLQMKWNLIDLPSVYLLVIAERWRSRGLHHPAGLQNQLDLRTNLPDGPVQIYIATLHCTVVHVLSPRTNLRSSSLAGCLSGPYNPHAKVSLVGKAPAGIRY